MYQTPNRAFEINLDGIIGPTHNYGGLSFGNVASMSHSKANSNPREAAKQGLIKMQALAKLGIKQAVFPPHERPYLPLIRSLGYQGSASTMIDQMAKHNPDLLITCCSSSNMWTANAATVCPSIDSKNQKVHFTPANLITKLHRFIETPTTASILKKLFSDSQFFEHHDPLPAHSYFSDEGAANHTRFCHEYGELGVQLFVFGRSAYQKDLTSPHRFPARQTLEASQAVARLHQISEDRTIFAQQNPTAIDAGVFHNDVISVGNQNVFFYHEEAFVNTPELMTQILKKMPEMHLIVVTAQQICLEEAVKTYLFNSQLVTLPDKTMALIAPIECEQSLQVHDYMQNLLKDSSHPIKQLIFQDVRQSMQNGGGPACLRLRVVLNEQEYAHMNQNVILTESLYNRLIEWVEKHYRDQLTFADLSDPQLMIENYQALDELTQILKLGAIYSFQ